MATVLFFQLIEHNWPTVAIFALAMFNGLCASVLLETIILRRGGMGWRTALQTAMGMSFISMLAMETAMNVADVAITGGARLTLTSVPVMLAAGFVAPWPYNYWRLKKYGQSCH